MKFIPPLPEESSNKLTFNDFQRLVHSLLSGCFIESMVLLIDENVIILLLRNIMNVGCGTGVDLIETFFRLITAEMKRRIKTQN